MGVVLGSRPDVASESDALRAPSTPPSQEGSNEARILLIAGLEELRSFGANAQFGSASQWIIEYVQLMVCSRG